MCGDPLTFLPKEPTGVSAHQPKAEDTASKSCVPPARTRTYLSDSSAAEDVLEPCEAVSGSASSSSLFSFRGEVTGGALGSLNVTVWARERGPSAAAAAGSPRGGLVRAEGASSSESELASWWVYWWISFSLRIIWRFGSGRTPNLHRGDRGFSHGQRGCCQRGPSIIVSQRTHLLSLFFSSGVSMSE